jgi:glyoxylase-like metal-dependent hydrolase (beta-lactamase superfamily II)
MANTVVQRLYALDGGSLSIEHSMLIAGRHFGTRIDVPVPMYLIETDEGYVLVDTGNDPRVIDDPIGTWGESLVAMVPPRMTEENHPYAQLARLGLEPSDVTLVIYTHLHHDHAGGARFFAHAPQVVQGSEYRYARHPDRFSSGIYLRSDFDHPEIDWRLIDGDVVVRPGLHLVHTPGHTPGHQSVVLWDVPDCGTVIIAGDAIYTRENVQLDLPSGVTTSAEDGLMSMRRLVALAEVADATLLVNHEMAFWALLPKAPEPLERPTDDIRCFWRDSVRPADGRAVRAPEAATELAMRGGA